MSATPRDFDQVRLHPAEPAGEPLALLAWARPAIDDRLVQVYVGGELYDVAADPAQREMWLVLDRSRAVTVALAAVAPERAWSPREDLVHADAMRPPTVALVRDEALPIDSRVTVELDGVAIHTSDLWAADDPRGGFGALFGLGEHGRDQAAAPGFGLADLGGGPFGFDHRAWRYDPGPLPAAPHALRVDVTDERGRAVAALTPIDVDIETPPPPARTFTIDRDFTLRWTLET